MNLQTPKSQIPHCSGSAKGLKDYYAVLGVLPSIDDGAIRAVYLNLLKKYHPDVYLGSKIDAEQRTKDLNEAYGVLGHEQKRLEYDWIRARIDDRLDEYKRKIIHENVEYREITNRRKYVSEYYREIHRLCIDLPKISPSLTLDYQISLFEGRIFRARAARTLAGLMKRQFMYSYAAANVSYVKIRPQASDRSCR